MNISNLLNQFLGAVDTSQEGQKGQSEGLTNKLSDMANAIPDGLAGGATDGRISLYL